MLPSTVSCPTRQSHPSEESTRRYFREQRQFQEAEPRLRSSRLEVTIPCHTWSTSVRPVHGCPTLRISQAQDPRNRESSPSTEAFSSQTDATRISIRSPRA